ncbi:hypothetical protein MMC13_006139 [Lambiella insularis]|nr:hypothetical protein [Lambiella insularis]
MSSIVITIFHAAQMAVSAYGLYVSYISITNLQQHEEKSEKAAEYLETAAYQLHKTRTTQASGAAAILASFVTALTLTTNPSLSSLTCSLSNIAMAGGALAARIHIGNFWQGKSRVPFVGGYNEGMRRTETMRQLLGLLAISWAVTGVLRLALK